MKGVTMIKSQTKKHQSEKQQQDKNHYDHYDKKITSVRKTTKFSSGTLFASWAKIPGTRDEVVRTFGATWRR
jgi:hypothetical protein